MVKVSGNKQEENRKVDLDSDLHAPSYGGWGNAQLAPPGGPHRQEVNHAVFLEIEERAKSMFAPSQRASVARLEEHRVKRDETLKDLADAKTESVEADRARDVVDSAFTKAARNVGYDRAGIEPVPASLSGHYEALLQAESRCTAAAKTVDEHEKKRDSIAKKVETSRIHLERSDEYATSMAYNFAGEQPYQKGYARRIDEMKVAQRGMGLSSSEGRKTLRQARHQLRADETQVMAKKWSVYESRAKERIEAIDSELLARGAVSPDGAKMLGGLSVESATKEVRAKLFRMGADADPTPLPGEKKPVNGAKLLAERNKLEREMPAVEKVREKWEQAHALASVSQSGSKKSNDATGEARKAFRDALAEEKWSGIALTKEPGFVGRVLNKVVSPALKDDVVRVKSRVVMSLGSGLGKAVTRSASTVGGSLRAGRDWFRGVWGSRGMAATRTGLHGFRMAIAGVAKVAHGVTTAAYQGANSVAQAMQSQDLGGIQHVVSSPLQTIGTGHANVKKGWQETVGAKQKIREKFERRAENAHKRNQSRDDRQSRAEKEFNETLSMGHAYLNNVRDYWNISREFSKARSADEENRLHERMRTAEDLLKKTYGNLKQFPDMARVLGFDYGAFHPENVVKAGVTIRESGDMCQHDYLERAMEASALGIPSKEAAHGDYRPVIDLGDTPEGANLSADVGGKLFKTHATRVVAVCHDGEVTVSVVGVHGDVSDGNKWGNSENALGEQLGSMKARDLSKAMGLEAEGKLSELTHPSVVPDKVVEDAMADSFRAFDEKLDRFQDKTRDEVDLKDRAAFDALVDQIERPYKMDRESSKSAAEMEAITADRELHERACRLLGKVPKSQGTGKPPSYTRVPDPGFISPEQVKALAALGEMHKEMGGLGMMLNGNEHHKEMVTQFNAKLKAGLASEAGKTVEEMGDDFGLKVRAESVPLAMMDELNQAMDRVTVKNGPEFIRLFDQVSGLMNAESDAVVRGNGNSI